MHRTKSGRGNCGHLGLILTLTKYQLATGKIFQPHLNLDSIPTFLANLTQPQIVQVRTTQKEQLRLLREQNILVKALKSNFQMPLNLRISKKLKICVLVLIMCKSEKL